MYTTENILLETYANKKELGHVYNNLHLSASHASTTFSDLKREVEFTMGSPLTEFQRGYLDWDYIAEHFWKEREVPQEPLFSPSDFLELKHFAPTSGTFGLGRY